MSTKILVCKRKSPLYEVVQYDGKNRNEIIKFCGTDNIIISKNGLHLITADKEEIKINPDDYIVSEMDADKLYLVDPITYNQKYELITTIEK